MSPESVRFFNVQPAQLADAIHDHSRCPFSHDKRHKKYVPREDCPRLQWLHEASVSYLKDASMRVPIAYTGKSSLT